MKALLLLAFAAAPAMAQAQDDAFDFFREEAQIYTASRRAEPAWRAPAAVDIVTAEEIKAYGYSTLADILRFRPGMDVIDGRSGDGGRTGLGRGLAVSALLGYKDAYDANSTTRGTRRSIDRSFRFDTRLSWTPRPDWELFLAGIDLLQPYRVESADGTASPRRFEAGATKRFGI